METNTPPTNALHNPSENPFALPPVEQATITESILDPDLAPPAKPAAKRRKARPAARARTTKSRGAAATRASKLSTSVTMPSHGPVDLYDHAALWCERGGAVLRSNVLNLSVAAVLVVVLIAANWATQQPGDGADVALVTASEPVVATPTPTPVPAPVAVAQPTEPVADAAPTLTASAEASPVATVAAAAVSTAVEAVATLPAPAAAAPNDSADTAPGASAAAEKIPSTSGAETSATIPVARVETAAPGSTSAMVAVTVTASLNPAVAAEAVAAVPATTAPIEPVAVVEAAPAATPQPEPVAEPVVVATPTPEAPVAQTAPVVAQKKIAPHHRVVARRHLKHPAAPLAKKSSTSGKKSVPSEETVFTSGGVKDLDNAAVRQYYKQQNQKLATRRVITVPAVNAPSPAANASAATNTAARTKP